MINSHQHSTKNTAVSLFNSTNIFFQRSVFLSKDAQSVVLNVDKIQIIHFLPYVISRCGDFYVFKFDFYILFKVHRIF